MRFEYFDPSEAEGITNFEKAIQRLTETRVMLDSGLLPLIEAAERGVFTAMCEVARLFSDKQTGVRPNYLLARHFHNAILEINRTTECPKTLVESYRNLGLLEWNFGNLEAAKKHFIEAIGIMYRQMRPEEWDFEVHYNLSSLVANAAL